MRRFVITLIGWLAIMVAVQAGTYVLTDATRIVGTPDSIADKGVVFALENGDFSPRIEWDRFTPDAIKVLMSEAKTDNDKQRLRPLFETIPQEVPKPREIVVKPVQTPERPKEGGGIFALFGSPVGWFILLALYGANMYAAYEVCVYRHQPVTRVCGLAAIPFFGVLSPIIYGSMPTQYLSAEPAAQAASVEETRDPSSEPAAAISSAPATARASAAAVSMSAAAPVAAPASAAALPEPIVFQKGDFSFNRRFFETKFAGFFRVIPSEAEKDLVLVIKASRGEFAGARISKITPAELYLQVVNNNVSADEMIPFAEIAEVQIRHKATL